MAIWVLFMDRTPGPVDGQILLFSVLLVPQVLYHDVTEDSWHQHVELLQVPYNVLGVALLFEQLPEVLDDFFAVGVSALLAFFILLV